MRFFKYFLLALAALTFVTEAQAQRRIEVGAEVWLEPGQTPEEIDMWFQRMADCKMRSARIFLMWNYIEVAPGKYDFTIADDAEPTCQTHEHLGRYSLKSICGKPRD